MIMKVMTIFLFNFRVYGRSPYFLFLFSLQIEYETIVLQCMKEIQMLYHMIAVVLS